MDEMNPRYKIHFNGGLDADTDFSLIENGRWVNAENIRTFSTDSGATNRIESIGGNALLTNPYLPAGENLTIGGVQDDANSRIFYLNWNSLGDHAIFCYVKTTDTFYKVLLNSQVTGGLNFDKYHLAHSVKYLDNKIYWVEAFWNEPRRINVEAGIKLNHPGYSTTVLPYTDPLPKWAITIIRRPAYYPLLATKKTDAGYVNNFMANQATQYAVRYLFRDYEYSVIGPYSVLIPYNTEAQTDNYAEIKMSLTEIIDQDILEAELIVRFGNTGKPSVIHTWTKTDIDAHNAGTPLSFDFYNDIAGISIDDVSANKAFESIALLAETLEVAKNRVWLGCLNEGYTTPSTSSLTTSIAAVSGTPSTLTGTWGTITPGYYDPGTGTELYGSPYSNYLYLYVPGAIPTFYYWTAYSLGPIPGSVTLSTADIQTNNLDDIWNYIFSSLTILTTYAPDTYSSSLTGTTISITYSTTVSGVRAFKSDGVYMVAIWFFDKYRRKCGVNYVDANKLKMPPRTYAQTTFNGGINWALSNVAALTEIPDWAHYYTIGRTRCLTTGFFIEANAANIFYVDKSSAGVYDYTPTSYAVTRYGVAIDISSIIGYGMGYTFTPSTDLQDLVNLYFATGPTGKQEMSILEQDGKWLILKLKDLGTLGSLRPLFEIYTPSKTLINEPFYEVGNIYSVVDPGLATRAYSVLTGLLNGDVYVTERESTGTPYFTENMSPNDLLWTRWQTDISWPNAIDKIGNVTIENKISFSDVYLKGTKVNGLSSFQVLNTAPIGSDGGKIYKLQLANKVEVDGSVMLCICQDETFSIYLGEAEVFDTQGSAFIAKSEKVIGSDKSLKGSFGTIDPTSVTLYNGKIWWYDSRNGAWVQYADNGLFNLAAYRFTRPTNLFSEKYKSLSIADIEALGSRPYVVGGYDPKHKELLFSIPATEVTPPKGTLVDYSGPDIIYPYDIYDGKEKTVIYKQERDMWFGSMPIQQEKFIRLGNELFSFKNGNCYIHNQAQPAFFNGVQYKSRLMYSNNPKGINTFKNIALEGNKLPTFIHFRTEYPYIQSSDRVIDNDFKTKQGVFYSPIFRDKLSPNVTGAYLEKLYKGDKMFGKALLVMLEYSFDDDIPMNLLFSNIIYTTNSGHLI